MEQIATDNIACLLVHGLNGLRYDFDDIAAHLRAEGFPTEQVLLPGHEVHAHEARKFGWRDWARAMQERFDHLAARHRRVVVIGHSMGGALALHLAAREPRVAAVAALCAPTALYPGLMPIVRLSRRLLPYMPLVREDIRDRAERREYRHHKVSQWVSLAPLHTLLQELPAVRAALPQVRCPTLLIGARNDHVVPLRDAYIIYNSIGSRQKQLFVLERSWHMVTRDVEREIVTDHIVAFMERMRAVL